MPTDLPPVEAPSAGFIVQLFVIPAAIVVVVVVVWLLFGKLAGGERDAMDYVQTIKDANENRRWRAAFELSSLIHNDARLARDPALLGALTDLLDAELAKPTGDEKVEEFLALSLGAFDTLDAQAPGAARKADPLAALAKAIGADRPNAVRLAAAESLARQAARMHESLDDAGAVKALAEATRADDARPPPAIGVRPGLLRRHAGRPGAAPGAELRRRLRPLRRRRPPGPQGRPRRPARRPRDALPARPAAAPSAVEDPDEAASKVEAFEQEILKALEVFDPRQSTPNSPARSGPPSSNRAAPAPSPSATRPPPS